MMNSDEFNLLNYQQNGDYCVLASYAVAAFPFTERPIKDYFSAYCSTYKLSLQGSFEQTYFHDFVNRYSLPGKNGYKVMNEFHNKSNDQCIIDAREKFTTEYIDNGVERINEIGHFLKESIKTIAIMFINKSTTRRLNSMHSITIGFNGEKYYYYDVNFGRIFFLSSTIQSVIDLGEIGNVILLQEA